MKFKTEITTRNWNNGWVDVDIRLPKDDTDCYILWRARLIKYNYDTMESELVKKYQGMGNAIFKNNIWDEITTESRCNDCWNQHTNNLFDEYFIKPLNESEPTYGTSPSGKEIITVGNYTIIDSDIFKSEISKANILWKYFEKIKGMATHKYMYLKF